MNMNTKRLWKTSYLMILGLCMIMLTAVSVTAVVDEDQVLPRDGEVVITENPEEEGTEEPNLIAPTPDQGDLVIAPGPQDTISVTDEEENQWITQGLPVLGILGIAGILGVIIIRKTRE
jgi:hypothetical protein